MGGMAGAKEGTAAVVVDDTSPDPPATRGEGVGVTAGATVSLLGLAAAKPVPAVEEAAASSLSSS
jgi:hypothetical protein